MKPIENTNGTDAALTHLVSAAAGAITTTLAAKLLRPHPAPRRRVHLATAPGQAIDHRSPSLGAAGKKGGVSRG